MIPKCYRIEPEENWESILQPPGSEPCTRPLGYQRLPCTLDPISHPNMRSWGPIGHLNMHFLGPIQRPNMCFWAQGALGIDPLTIRSRAKRPTTRPAILRSAPRQLLLQGLAWGPDLDLVPRPVTPRYEPLRLSAPGAFLRAGSSRLLGGPPPLG